jgi:hypothetical protein
MANGLEITEIFLATHSGYTSVLAAVRRVRQEDSVFEASLGYKARPCLKKEPGTVAHICNPRHFAEMGESRFKRPHFNQ